MKNKRGPWSGHPVRWFSLTALCGIRYSGYGAGSSRSSRAILEAESSLASVGSEATPVAVYAPVESALLSIHNWLRPLRRNASCRGSGTLPRTPTATPMPDCSTIPLSSSPSRDLQSQPSARKPSSQPPTPAKRSKQSGFTRSPPRGPQRRSGAHPPVPTAKTASCAPSHTRRQACPVSG